MRIQTLSRIVWNGHALPDVTPCNGVIELQELVGAPLGYADTSFWRNIKAANNSSPYRYNEDDWDDIWMTYNWKCTTWNTGRSTLNVSTGGQLCFLIFESQR